MNPDLFPRSDVSAAADKNRTTTQIKAEMECLSCGNNKYSRTFTAREFLFGTKDTFEYFECESCGSLQIYAIPQDLQRHYPPDYYSIVGVDRSIESISYFRRLARGARTDYHIGRATPVGWAIDKIAPNRFQLTWEWFRGYASTGSRILDIGCGSGHLLRSMHEQGFR